MFSTLALRADSQSGQGWLFCVAPSVKAALEENPRGNAWLWVMSPSWITPGLGHEPGCWGCAVGSKLQMGGAEQHLEASLH